MYAGLALQVQLLWFSFQLTDFCQLLLNNFEVLYLDHVSYTAIEELRIQLLQVVFSCFYCMCPVLNLVK